MLAWYGQTHIHIMNSVLAKPHCDFKSICGVEMGIALD